MNGVKQTLSKEEMERYRTYYCRICNALSIRYGYRYRILVNYDVVVYMILTKMALGDTFYCYKHKCQAKHLCGMKDFKNDELGQFFSVLVGESVRVAIADKLLDGGKKKYKFFRFLFRKVFKPKDEKEKSLDKQAQEQMRALAEFEKQGLGLDYYLEYYGKAVVDCIEYYYPNIDKDYTRLIALIAKWTNYMDMLEDYNEDVKDGSFNPLIREDAKTLDKYFAKYWSEIRDVMFPMTTEMNRLATKIRPEEYSLEWEIIAKVVKLVIPETTRKILSQKSKKSRFMPTD